MLWTVLWVHIFSLQMYSMFLEGTWVYQVCVAQNWVLQKIFTEWNDFLHLKALPRNIAQYPIRVISYLKMWFANEEELCSTFLFSKASLWVRFLFRGKTYISNYSICVILFWMMNEYLKTGEIMSFKLKMCSYPQRVTIQGTRNLMGKFRFMRT